EFRDTLSSINSTADEITVSQLFELVKNIRGTLKKHQRQVLEFRKTLAPSQVPLMLILLYHNNSFLSRPNELKNQQLKSSEFRDTLSSINSTADEITVSQLFELVNSIKKKPYLYCIGPGSNCPEFCLKPASYTVYAKKVQMSR
ncbi:MAG: hypothetical protein J6036_01775, partial [Clostridia bacterium]|nr:hypothetical protein [Clostridia bacterium]